MTDTREARLQLLQALTEAEAARKPSMLFAPKWMQAALGNCGDTQFLQGLSYMEQHPEIFHPVKLGGYSWIERKGSEFAEYFVVPYRTLFSEGGVVARLHSLGLIHKDSRDRRSTLLRVDAERMALLALCTFALYTKTEPEWRHWLSRNRALPESFSYVTASGARVHLFPGCGERPKSYPQCTPYAPTVEDEALGRRLLSIWSQHRRGGKNCDGIHNSYDGFHNSYDENHHSGVMDSITENGRNSRQPKDLEPVQRIELLEEGKEEPDFVRDNFVVLRSRLERVSGEEEKKLQVGVECTASYFFDRRSYSSETITELTATLVRKWRKDFGDYYESPETFLQAWAGFTEQCVDVKRGAPAPEPKTIDELWPHPCNRVWKAFVLAHEPDPAISAND